MSKPLLQINDLHKHYQMGSEDLHVLRGVTTSVESGQWVGIFGSSGSGKSTLLHLVAGLDTPGAGEVLFEDKNIFSMSMLTGLNRYRNKHVGLVFQFYHLLPELTVLENVLISAMIGSTPFTWPLRRKMMTERAMSTLERVGLAERLKHKPKQLSGGERQRVAIARALINQPQLLLADEPTGNLDRETGGRILDLFAQLHDEGQTIIMVSHDPQIAARTDHTLTLESGRLKDD